MRIVKHEPPVTPQHALLCHGRQVLDIADGRADLAGFKHPRMVRYVLARMLMPQCAGTLDWGAAFASSRSSIGP
jgi:hypothetical protein